MRRAVLGLVLVGLAGCATYSSATVDRAAAVMITENDITDRPYSNLGDINVTVRKTTIFNADPIRESVGQALREKAASLGADAVVLIRYGTVGIGAFSWGQMDGSGRAVQFVR